MKALPSGGRVADPVRRVSPHLPLQHPHFPAYPQSPAE
jgi:hypothetical protein